MKIRVLCGTLCKYCILTSAFVFCSYQIRHNVALRSIMHRLGLEKVYSLYVVKMAKICFQFHKDITLYISL